MNRKILVSLGLLTYANVIFAAENYSVEVKLDKPVVAFGALPEHKWMGGEASRSYQFQVTVKNTSKTARTFYVEDKCNFPSWLIKSEDANVAGGTCYEPNLKKITIKPQEAYSTPLGIFVPNTFQKKNLVFKIGFQEVGLDLIAKSLPVWSAEKTVQFSDLSGE